MTHSCQNAIYYKRSEIINSLKEKNIIKYVWAFSLIAKLKGKDKEEYEEYLKMKKDVETQKQNADNSLKLYSEMQNKLINAEKKLKKW